MHPLTTAWRRQTVQAEQPNHMHTGWDCSVTPRHYLGHGLPMQGTACGADGVIHDGEQYTLILVRTFTGWSPCGASAAPSAKQPDRGPC